MVEDCIKRVSNQIIMSFSDIKVNIRMEKRQIVLTVIAALVAIVSALTLKAHKRGAGSLFTASGTRIACSTTNQGLGVCPLTIPLYTKATAPHTIYTAQKFSVSSGV
jgi:hypothetical protein